MVCIFCPFVHWLLVLPELQTQSQAACFNKPWSRLSGVWCVSTHSLWTAVWLMLSTMAGNLYDHSEWSRECSALCAAMRLLYGSMAGCSERFWAGRIAAVQAAWDKSDTYLIWGHMAGMRTVRWEFMWLFSYRHELSTFIVSQHGVHIWLNSRLRY